MATQADFTSFAGFIFNNLILPVQHKKGQEYTNNDDAFVNFDMGAQILKMSPEQYLLVMATKHWAALSIWSQGKVGAPPTVDEIFQRCIDIIIYMLLLMFMVKCKRQQNQVKE